MKVLVIGEGAAEHAIVWSLLNSRHIDRIFCSPGNAGIAEIAECINVNPNNYSALIDFVKYEWIDLIIVGPKHFLSEGIVDAFEKEGCKILGPNKNASQLISSRVFAKNLLQQNRILSPEYKVFTSYIHAQDYVRLKGTPVLIKTDSSLNMNGVYLALTVEEALKILKLIMNEQTFISKGNRIIIEESLKGEHVSFGILTDGETIKTLPGLHKYENKVDGDALKNKKGMWAYSPVNIITKELRVHILEKIIKPTIRALHLQGIAYKGLLYADLVIYNGNPYVIEFDGCFGDPETQTILPRMETDLAEFSLAIIEERLSDIDIKVKPEASVCVALLSESYAGKTMEHAVIEGLEEIKMMKDILVFHENTLFSENKFVTSGNRVISIIATGMNVRDAKTKAHKAIEKIYFDGMRYEIDIIESDTDSYKS